jgi:glyoxylase-like metal-dependent hydrolase (beta-lactamase superfamily II)
VSDDVVELVPGFWSLGQKLGGQVHAFLCVDGEELTLVDTLYDKDGARILRLIERIGRQPSDLRHIIMTHAHRSHLGGLARLKEVSGATVYAHEWEADIIAREREAQRPPIFPGRPLRAYVPFQLGAALGFGNNHPPVKVDHFVAGGDKVGPLEVIDASGHSPGHLGFVWHDRAAMIAGDAVVTWPAEAPGWASFTLNERQHRAALRRLVEVEAKVCGVGHGAPIAENARERVRDIVDTLGA